MKKMYLLLLSTFLFTACEKSKDLKLTDTDDAARHMSGSKNECLLINLSSEYGSETFEYDRKDLVSKWTVIYPGYEAQFLLEHDFAGRLVTAKFNDLQGVLYYTIKFIHRGGYIVKETWYAGDTEDVIDEVIYTRNYKGKILKAESKIGDYYTIYKYTPDGNNVKWWKFFVGGVAAYQGEYTYLKPYRNPTSAIRGLGNGFPFISGSYYENKLYSTSERFTYFDENGDPVISGDQDPSKTVSTANSKNFVVTSDFYNILSDDYVHFVFDYENCGYCKNCNTKNTSNTQSSATRIRQETNPSKLMLRGSAASIKEKIQQFRKARGY